MKSIICIVFCTLLILPIQTFSCLLSTDAANESNDDVQEVINHLDNSAIDGASATLTAAQSDNKPDNELKNDENLEQLRTTKLNDENTRSENGVAQEVKVNDELNVISEFKPLPNDKISTNKLNSENDKNELPSNQSPDYIIPTILDGSQELLTDNIIEDTTNTSIRKNDSKQIEINSRQPSLNVDEIKTGFIDTNNNNNVEKIDDKESTPPPSIQNETFDDNNITELDKNDTNIDIAIKDLNLTVEEDQIPVFSEWAQKRLEEAEKQGEQDVVNSSTMKRNASAINKAPVLKLKSAKNYASPDCGAKIIASNSESSGTGHVLSSNRDEYLLSPCKSRIWFIVELCEAIQAERIDLANFELFSSSPKNFSVGVGNRFPTRDWSNVGRFIAKDERYVQSFDLHPHLFGKYVRVDIHSHYNSEHFCPISLFRVYGTSEFEAFETENRPHGLEEIDDDEVELIEQSGKEKSNIFKSASDAVISIVKKTASFLNPQENKTNSENQLNDTKSKPNCITPNFISTCTKCSDNFTNEMNALLQCKHEFLIKLLNVDLIKNSLFKSKLCANLVGPLQNDCREHVANVTAFDWESDYVLHLFPLKYLTAMCNLLAAVDRKISINSTIAMNADVPTNITIDKKVKEILQGKRPKIRSELPDGKIPIALDGEIRTEGKPNVEKTENSSTTSESTESTKTDKAATTESASNSEQKTTEANSEASTTEDVTESKKSQNIFNVVENDKSTEITEVQGSGTTRPTEEVINNNQTETTTTTESASTQVPVSVPTSADMNDVNDDHASAPQFGQKLHSESVFLRLSNRVKALERNMSLSGQYLEELSRRYKRQVEELQVSFAKALLNIEEQSRRSIERKQELFEQNQKLRDDLEMLTKYVFSWRNIIIFCITFFILQIFLFYIVLRLYTQKYFPQHIEPISADEMEDLNKIGTQENRRRKSGNVSTKVRRKSAEEKRQRTLSTESTSLQRRPSTEALKITGTYEELLIKNYDDDDEDEIDIQELGTPNSLTNNKKRTKTKHQKNDAHESFVRIEDLKQLYDKPALSDDYEIYGIENGLTNGDEELKEYDDSESTMDSSIDITPEKKSPQGKLTQPIRKTSVAKEKLFKAKNRTRHLSSPSFFKAPFTGPKPGGERATGWEWHRNKATKSTKSSHNNNGKKSKSESPESFRFNGIHKNSLISNNSDKSYNENDSARSSFSSSNDCSKKDMNSFKRFIKKIF